MRGFSRNAGLILAMCLAIAGCSGDDKDTVAAKPAAESESLGAAFEVPAPIQAAPSDPIDSVGDYPFVGGPAVLGSVVELVPDTDVDPAALAAGEVTVEEYAARSVLAVVNVEEVLHGPALPEAHAQQIRVAVPGTLVVSLTEATARAVAAGPVVWVVGDAGKGEVGDGLYLAGGIFVREGDTFVTPFFHGVDGGIQDGMGISTFDELVDAFRAL